MSGRWWRAYSRARHDPKLLKLSDKHFRWWFNFVCAAADNDGALPSYADLAVEFRTPEKAITKLLDELVRVGLLDKDVTVLRPHNWNGLQYKSDTSADRMRRHRERHRDGESDVTRTVTVTRSESESEADTETDSVPNGTGAKAPARDVIFQECLPWLEKRSGKNCRALVGKWLSETRDDEAIRQLLEDAEHENPMDPVSWISARLKPKEPHETYDQRRIRAAREAIQ